MDNQPDSQRGMTRREAIKKGVMIGGALAWAVPVVQTVGMSRALAEDFSPGCRPQWADSVYAFSQGPNMNGGPITDPARIDPTKATGPTDGNFFSLGFGGSIVLELALASGVGGTDVITIEVTKNPAGYPEELAEVAVSQNGAGPWTVLGIASGKDPSGESMFTVPAAVDFFKFVRLVDKSNKDAFIGVTPPADGFDIDSVRVSCA